MISTIPVMIMFISSILKIEKTNIFQILGVICSFIGVIFIITKANIDLLLNLNFNKGDLTMVIAMLSWVSCMLIQLRGGGEEVSIPTCELLGFLGFLTC